MTYSYHEIVKGDASELEAEILNFLNGLNQVQAESAKIASSDQSGGDARAVIIYCNPDSHKPDTSKLGSPWQDYHWRTGSDYHFLYQSCTDYLGSLPDASAFDARVCMTNAGGNDSFLFLYWRS